MRTRKSDIIDVTIQKDITGFAELSRDYKIVKEDPKKARTIDDIRKDDLDGIVFLRKLFAWLLLFLLFLQNVWVLVLVTIALNTHQLGELMLIFSILVAATLTETYVSIKFMVQYIFHDLSYSSDKN